MEENDKKFWDLTLENKVIKDNLRAELDIRLGYYDRKLGAIYRVVEYTEIFNTGDYFPQKDNPKRTMFDTLKEAQEYYDSL